jgi:hypothetical protein
MGDGFRECGCECGRLESLAMKSVKSLFLFQHGVGEGYSRLDGWMKWVVHAGRCGQVM